MINEAIQKERENLRFEVTSQIKFEKIIIDTSCRPFAILPRDHEDHQDNDAHPEGESNAKRQNTIEHGTYLMGESSFGYAMEQEHEPNLSGSEIDEVKLQKAIDEMLRQRCNSGEEHQYHVDQMQNYLKSDIVWESGNERLSLLTPKKRAPVVRSCQRGPKAPPMTLLNQEAWELRNKEQKVNLTAPTIIFLGIEEYELFNITSEPVVGMIDEKSKKEKRVMIHKEIHKFCDATLKRVLETLKKYNKDVKYGYVDPSPSDDDAEYLRYYEEDIKDRLKHQDHMRRWEMVSRRRQPAESSMGIFLLATLTSSQSVVTPSHFDLDGVKVRGKHLDEIHVT
ncbi:hypothetical protein Tco_0154222 [Tanacetum coccineum]